MAAQPRRINIDEQCQVQSLTTVIIRDQAITTQKIANGAVTGDKLAPIVAGSGLTFLTGALRVNVDNITLETDSDILRIKSGGVTPSHLNINSNLDFNSNQALKFRLENVSFDPAPGNPGRLIWRTDLLQIKVDDGVSFIGLAGGGGGGHIIKDEGTPLTQRAVLNFVGSGVTVTDGGTETTVSIPGGAGATYSQEGFVVVNPLSHNFVLSNTPIANSEIVLWNGLGLTKGLGNDYTISGATITLVAGITLSVGDQISVVYQY